MVIPAHSSLWFASNLLFLHYQSQLWDLEQAHQFRCDLLRIYYFCTINHSPSSSCNGSPPLWFASNLLFLHYQSQHRQRCISDTPSCDLLRIYYFCTINHSVPQGWRLGGLVVICFEFIIFALSITAWQAERRNPRRLWFASNLLFLHYQSQLLTRRRCEIGCCDLLRIYYFCTINHSGTMLENIPLSVVICFEFIIFALSITAEINIKGRRPKLWFASNLLFLHYQSQRATVRR